MEIIVVIVVIAVGVVAGYLATKDKTKIDH